MEGNERKKPDCLGFQIYREVGANVLIATLCIFFLMCYSVYGNPQLVSDSTLLLLQFMYSSVVVALIHIMYFHDIDLFT
jgi:hypothetical protein